MDDDILKDFDSLERNERTAFIAWFHGGATYVRRQEGFGRVSFGKAECEWVDFDSVWLGKFIQLGFITAKVQRYYISKGMIGEPKSVEYKLWPTDKGFDVHEAYWKRIDGRIEELEMEDACLS